jgi:hypothetical protein
MQKICKIVIAFLVLIITPYKANAMEAPKQGLDTMPALVSDIATPQEPEKPKKRIRIRQVAPLTVLAAKAVKNSLFHNLDEFTIDTKADHLKEMFDRTNEAVQYHIADQLTYANPYPLYHLRLKREHNWGYFDDHYYVDALSNQHYITYRNFDSNFRVVQKNNDQENILLEFNTHKYNDVHYMHGNYIVAQGNKIFELYGLSNTIPALIIRVNTEAGSSIIENTVSKDGKHIALGLSDKTIVFWHYNEISNQWEKKEEETLHLEQFDNLNATNYNYRFSLQEPRRLHKKKTDTINGYVPCHSVSTLTFLENSSSPQQPLLLVGLKDRQSHSKGHGIVTIWNYCNATWNLTNILKDKHDWPVVTIQPSFDGTAFLTCSYNPQLLRQFITCWKANENGEWSIIKRTRQMQPTYLKERFFPHSALFAFCQTSLRHNGQQNSCKIFSVNAHACSKIKKLTIKQFNKYKTLYSNEDDKINIVNLGNDQIALGNKIFHLTPSIAYALCQTVLQRIVENKKGQAERDNGILQLHSSKTFEKLTSEEQVCLRNYFHDYCS